MLAIIQIIQLRGRHNHTGHGRHGKLNTLITILIHSKILEKEVEIVADIVACHLIRLVHEGITIILKCNLKDTILQVLLNADSVIQGNHLQILDKVNGDRSVRVSHYNGMLSYTAAMDSIFCEGLLLPI